MKNFIQSGRSVTVTAPGGGVTSGVGVLIGNLFGVAQFDAAAGEEVEILTQDVVEIAKTSALAISVGDRLFWDDTNKVVNKTATAQVCIWSNVSSVRPDSSTIRRSPSRRAGETRCMIGTLFPSSIIGPSALSSLPRPGGSAISSTSSSASATMRSNWADRQRRSGGRMWIVPNM